MKATGQDKVFQRRLCSFFYFYFTLFYLRLFFLVIFLEVQITYNKMYPF